MGESNWNMISGLTIWLSWLNQNDTIFNNGDGNVHVQFLAKFKAQELVSALNEGNILDRQRHSYYQVVIG